LSLSNTAVPYYYGQFRDAVLRGEIPVNREISMEMNRIDGLIANPNIYYDDQAVNGFILYCENELTLTGAELENVALVEPQHLPQFGGNHDPPELVNATHCAHHRRHVLSPASHRKRALVRHPPPLSR